MQLSHTHTKRRPGCELSFPKRPAHHHLPVFAPEDIGVGFSSKLDRQRGFLPQRTPSVYISSREDERGLPSPLSSAPLLPQHHPPGSAKFENKRINAARFIRGVIWKKIISWKAFMHKNINKSRASFTSQAPS